MQGRQIAPQAPARVNIGIPEYAAKYQTKKEVYDFLTQNVKAVCPPADTVTIWHLRDMVSGVKGYIKGTEMKYLTVPYYEDLTIDKMLTWARTNHSVIVDRFFPEAKELKKFPRQVSICVMLLFLPLNRRCRA